MIKRQDDLNRSFPFCLDRGVATTLVNLDIGFLVIYGYKYRVGNLYLESKDSNDIKIGTQGAVKKR